MGVLDPQAIRADAQGLFGRLADTPATWGVLPEGIVVEAHDGARYRLTRSEPCLFLGPPERSKLLLVAAILDMSETSPDAVRAFVTVPVAQLGGLWFSGLEDAVTRFPVAEVDRERPELVVLAGGTLVWRLGELAGTGLPRNMPAVTVGRERGGDRRRAIVLVRGLRQLDPCFYDDGKRD